MPDDKPTPVNPRPSARPARPSAPTGPAGRGDASGHRTDPGEIRCLVDPLASRCRGGILLRAIGPAIDPAPAQRRLGRPGPGAGAGAGTGPARNADSRAA
jgi:hypothetical protein